MKYLKNKIRKIIKENREYHIESSEVAKLLNTQIKEITDKIHKKSFLMNGDNDKNIFDNNIKIISSEKTGIWYLEDFKNKDKKIEYAALLTYKIKDKLNIQQFKKNFLYDENLINLNTENLKDVQNIISKEHKYCDSLIDINEDILKEYVKEKKEKDNLLYITFNIQPKKNAIITSVGVEGSFSDNDIKQEIESYENNFAKNILNMFNENKDLLLDCHSKDGIMLNTKIMYAYCLSERKRIKATVKDQSEEKKEDTTTITHHDTKQAVQDQSDEVKNNQNNDVLNDKKVDVIDTTLPKKSEIFEKEIGKEILEKLINYKKIFQNFYIQFERRDITGQDYVNILIKIFEKIKEVLFGKHADKNESNDEKIIGAIEKWKKEIFDERIPKIWPTIEEYLIDKYRNTMSRKKIEITSIAEIIQHKTIKIQNLNDDGVEKMVKKIIEIAKKVELHDLVNKIYIHYSLTMLRKKTMKGDYKNFSAKRKAIEIFAEKNNLLGYFNKINKTREVYENKNRRNKLIMSESELRRLISSLL